MSHRIKITLALLALIFALAGCQLPAVTHIPPTAIPGTPVPPTQTDTPWPAFQTLAPLPTATSPATPTRAPSSTPFPTGSPTPVLLGPVNLPAGVNPLTGLKVADPSRLERRPVMVKVSNYPRTGRPHAGLSAADLVFEYYIGEYENRFLAVYYGQDATRIGPLRSGRLVDAQLVTEYGGILIYGNADPRVDKVLVDALGTRAITFDDAPCPPICGKDTHSEEGVFVNSKEATTFAVAQKINNDKPDLRSMLFDTRLPVSKTPASFISILFGPENQGDWHFDPTSGTYLRWIEEQRGSRFVQVPLVDRNTGKQLAFENITILFSRYNELLPTMFEMEMTGNTEGQRAVYFRDGLMIEGRWQSQGSDRPPALLNAWGLPMPFKPGKNWIVVVGLSSGLTQAEPGHWVMEYHTK